MSEWRAEQMLDMASDNWRVMDGEFVVCYGLDRDTAHRIAAVNELEAAVKVLLDIEWTRKQANRHSIAREFARAALAKARGET